MQVNGVDIVLQMHEEYVSVLCILRVIGGMVGIALTIKSSVSHWSWDDLSTYGIFVVEVKWEYGYYAAMWYRCGGVLVGRGYIIYLELDNGEGMFASACTQSGTKVCDSGE